MARKGKRELAFAGVKNIYMDGTGYDITMMVRGQTDSRRYKAGVSRTFLIAEAAAMRTRLNAQADKQEARTGKDGTMRTDCNAFLAGWSGKNKGPITNQLHHWCVALGDTTPRKHVTSQRIREVIADWLRKPQASNDGKPYAQETVIKLLRTLRQVWRTLDGKAAANPANDVDTPPTPKPVARALDFDEADQIIYSMRPSYTRACLKMQRHLGVMAIELKRLHKHEVRWKQGTIKISRRQKGHGSHERTLPFGRIDAARAAVEEYASYDKWAVNGKELTWDTDNLRKALVARANALGLAPGCRAYDLRHTFATEMFKRNGGNIRSVQKWLGHEKVETTQRYILGGDDDQLIADADAVNEYHKARKAEAA